MYTQGGLDKVAQVICRCCRSDSIDTIDMFCLAVANIGSSIETVVTDVAEDDALAKAILYLLAVAESCCSAYIHFKRSYQPRGAGGAHPSLESPLSYST